MHDPQPTPVLILIGLRGSGKTTLGKRLGKERGVPWVDLDDVTAKVLRALTAQEAFGQGEAAFRAAERKAFAQTLANGAGVISFGGGTPTAPGVSGDIEDAKRSHRAIVVYLRAAPRTLRERLAKTALASRPSLTGLGTLEEIEAIFSRRDELYRAIADHVIEVDALSEEAAAAKLAVLFTPR